MVLIIKDILKSIITLIIVILISTLAFADDIEFQSGALYLPNGLITNGNVGIGTTSTNAKLTVAGNNMIVGGVVEKGSYGATSTRLELQNVDSSYLNIFGNVDNGAVGNYQALAFGINPTFKFAVMRSASKGLETLPLTLWVGSIEGLRIDTLGNVGIGTTDPGTSKLKVAGTIESSSGGIKFPDGTVQATAGGGNIGGGWTDDGTTVRLTANSDKVAIGTLTASTAGALTVYGNEAPGGTSLVNEGLVLGQVTGASGYSWMQSYGGKPLVINPISNNVGIGTTNPEVKLQVGSIAGSYQASGGQAVRIYGTNTPMDVNNGASAGMINIFTTDAVAVDKGGSISFGGIFSAIGENVDFAGIAGRKEGAGSAGYLQFATRPNTGNLGERMRITSTGNVGIGTTDPGTSKLKVAGTIESSSGGIKFPDGTVQATAGGGNIGGGWTDDGTTVRLTTAGDNVGMGTPTPIAKLDVEKEDTTISVGTKTSNGWTNANGIIGFPGYGVEHGQIAFYPTDRTFALIDSSQGDPGKDYGALNTLSANGDSPAFTDLWVKNLRASRNIGVGGTPTEGYGGISGNGIAFPSTSDDAQRIYGEHDGVDNSNLILEQRDNPDDGVIFRNVDWNPQVGSVDYMKISKDKMYYTGGNVGIGTTDPGTSKLKVAGTIETTSGIKFPDGTVQATAGGGNIGGGWTDDGTTVRLTTSTDNVGIGLATGTSPETKLHVAGGIRADSVIYSYSDNTYLPATELRTWGINKPVGADSNLYIEWGNVNNGNMYITDHWKYTQPLYVQTGPIHLMAGNRYGLIVNTDGNVGIGTTSPGAKLETAGTARFSLSSEPTTYYMDIVPAAAAAGDVRYDFRIKDFGGLQDQAAFTINGQTGNVGIGTTDPKSKIHIISPNTQDNNYGDFTVENAGSTWSLSHFATYSNTAAHSSQLILRRARGTISSPTSVINGDQLGGLFIRGYDGLIYQQRAGISGFVSGAVSSGNVPTDLSFYTGSTSALERMRILSTGNVGIGTASPGSKLTVIGRESVSENNLLNNGGYSWASDLGATWGTYRPSLVTDGIEITDYYGGSAATEPKILFHDYSYGGPRLRFSGSSDHTLYLEDFAGDYLRHFRVTGVQDMTVDGNVGIGTATPTGSVGASGVFSADKLLDIHKDGWGDDDDDQLRVGDLVFNSRHGGSSEISSSNQRGSNGNLVIATTGQPNQLWLLVNGNVGIGTGDPGAYKLKVAGDISGTKLCIADDCRNAWPSGSGGTVTGTGTANIIPIWNGASVLGNSIITYDTTNNKIVVGGGSGKIDAGTVDPIYTINGKQYATYLPAMTGVKEETIGIIKLINKDEKNNYKYEIDFNNLEEGSDLWLFSKTTNLKENFDRMVVLLTPSFNGNVWYEKDFKNNRLNIFATSSTQNNNLEISYRLTAPRFDYKEWSNKADSENEGFNLDKQK